MALNPTSQNCPRGPAAGKYGISGRKDRAPSLSCQMAMRGNRAVLSLPRLLPGGLVAIGAWATISPVRRTCMVISVASLLRLLSGELDQSITERLTRTD